MLQVAEETINEIRGVFENGTRLEDQKRMLDHTLWAYSYMADNPELVLNLYIVGPKDAENVRGIIFEEMIFFLQEQGIITGDWYGR